ncbi:DUF262 domain-containing protein [Flavobacterium branchiophilum]|uniref:GmrSD restriction endonucleases N-terminal domain-containing protein n=2 Tax=Flavobacterium branchiophilum TaxID=55197 RepID=G2Z506_FLABF|nr:DUF262 domain-containing protein [Flavobacterium branchiophilum]CCB70727.1 Hypothetical protein FBFL15_2737 [Flavobacterium branchiophilum FL-15]
MENMDKENFNEIEGEETLSFEAKEKLNKPDEENPYPYENINIGRDNFSAFELHRKYKNGDIILVQEKSNWDLIKKSKFIESILLGFPVPLFFVKQNDEGQLIVLDGNERLKSIFEFIENKYALKNLEILKNFTNCFFSNQDKAFSLPIKYKSRLEDVSFSFSIIKKPTAENIIQKLIERIKN